LEELKLLLTSISLKEQKYLLPFRRLKLESQVILYNFYFSTQIFNVTKQNICVD